MKLKDQVLSILLANTHHSLSGQEIANQLFVTRSGIWKAIEELRKDGYTIIAATNRGYILKEDEDILSEAIIRGNMKNSDWLTTVEIHKVLSSTNTTARERLVNHAQNGHLIVADTQSQGRGRMGRSFYSPPGTGAYFSIILSDPTLNAQNNNLLTICGALAVVKVIASLSPYTPEIKWVNDILLGGKKVCGILTEGISNLETGVLQEVVMGFGINLRTENFGELSSTATSLFLDNINRSQLIGRILDQLYTILTTYHPDKIIEEYRSYSCLLGKRIDYQMNGKQGTGTVLAINEDGNLVIQTGPAQTLTLIGGEVTLHK